MNVESDFTLVHKNKKATEIFFQSLAAVRGGFEPPERLPVRQFSKLVVSATHPSHQTPIFRFCECKCKTFFYNIQIEMRKIYC